MCQKEPSKYTRTQANHKMEPGVNFINVLLEAFARTEPKSIKKTVKSSIFLRFWDLRAQNLYVNMLVKLTPGVLDVSTGGLRTELNFTLFTFLSDEQLREPKRNKLNYFLFFS